MRGVICMRYMHASKANTLLFKMCANKRHFKKNRLKKNRLKERSETEREEEERIEKKIGIKIEIERKSKMKTTKKESSQGRKAKVTLNLESGYICNNSEESKNIFWWKLCNSNVHVEIFVYLFPNLSDLVFQFEKSANVVKPRENHTCKQHI